MAGDERAREVDAVVRRVARWAARRDDVRGLALVGSRARGAARPGSDVDLVLLTDDPPHYIEREDWLRDVGATSLVRTREWGTRTERRVALPGGLEVDLLVALPDWAALDPLDAGTRKVVVDGMRILHDPDGLLAALAAACGRELSPPRRTRSGSPRSSE